MSGDNASNGASTGGIGFCGLLMILFIGLKLTGYIAWSWWLVLAPMWIPLMAILLSAIIIVSVIGVTNKIWKLTRK